MLDAFTTYERFLNKTTPSYALMYVALIELPLENVNFDKHHFRVFLMFVIVCIQMT